MLKAFLDKHRQKKATKEWHRSALGQALADNAHKCFYGESILTGSADSFKQEVITDFYEKIFGLMTAPNPFLTMREYIASYMFNYATFQVLCLKEVEKAAWEYSDCPYISGELYKHIQKLSEYNEELKKLKWKTEGISDEELILTCNFKSALYIFYMNGMNYVRCELKDMDTKKDWLHPFAKSMLIWQEDFYRGEIGLTSLLPDSFDAIRHSTFMNMVKNGHENPFYEWEKAWKADIT